MFKPRTRLLTSLLALAFLTGCGLPMAAPPNGNERAMLQALETKRHVAVAIPYKTSDQLTSLVNSGMDLWGVTDDVAYGTIDKGTLEVAKKLGLTVKYRADLRDENTYDPKYRTYEKMVQDMKALAAKYPQLCKLVDLGDSWEKSKGKADRDIWGLRIGTGDLASKPGVAFLGEHHARELVTSEISYMLAEHLLANYGKDAEATFAVDNREIWVVPMVNPDGHVLAEQGKDWRKNTDTSYGLTSFGYGPEGPGVDLNRNYGYSWDKAPAGSSKNPSHATFRGSAPFSEPETQAVRSLLSSRKFTYALSYHSFSNVILWPWGYTHEAPPDKRLPAIGKKLADSAGYEAKQSAGLYVHGGTTNDWAFGELGILCYTSEIGTYEDGFDPPYSKLPQFWKENLPGAMYLLKTADNPADVFGPELKPSMTESPTFQAPGAVAAEVFYGRPGAPGTGQALQKTAQGFVLPAGGAQRLALVHARDAKGNWGAFEAVWAR